jgi:hypothetical protein
VSKGAIMDWKEHCYRVGSNSAAFDALPGDHKEIAKFAAKARKVIEPWLSAVFQSEHLSLVLGSGFTSAVGYVAGARATDMSKVEFKTEYDTAIDVHATSSATKMERGQANIEDQFRSALAVLDGLEVIAPEKAKELKKKIDEQLLKFLHSLLETEDGIRKGASTDCRIKAEGLLVSFLLSFASRTATRERLHIFTTNYDRLIEHGCDLAGLRIIDRFVGALNPVFRSARIEVDMHYNPPGIRGEPRFMEGVIRLSKLHGSLDWQYDPGPRLIRKNVIPFGAGKTHTDVPKQPIDTVMIYPNPAKDVETTQYPYAELFRDFAASVCKPNSVVVTYGYGFGDDHINRVLKDMLTIPSTHLVIIAWHQPGKKPDARITSFCNGQREAQISLLLGSHFGDLSALVEHYLPKPALDYITGRMTELLKHRPDTGIAVQKEVDSSESGGSESR